MNQQRQPAREQHGIYERVYNINHVFGIRQRPEIEQDPAYRREPDAVHQERHACGDLAAEIQPERRRQPEQRQRRLHKLRGVLGRVQVHLHAAQEGQGLDGQDGLAGSGWETHAQPAGSGLAAAATVEEAAHPRHYQGRRRGQHEGVEEWPTAMLEDEGHGQKRREGARYAPVERKASHPEGEEGQVSSVAAGVHRPVPEARAYEEAHGHGRQQHQRAQEA